MEKTKKGVRLEHISKIYQDPKTGKDFYAVKDNCLTIEPGEFVTLLGPSGCGKTTTLRMIAGFESPDEGEIYLGGEAINEQNVRYVIGLARSGQEEKIGELTQDVICISAKGRPIKPKTIGQKEYVDSISQNTVTIGVGPAGTGKTYLAVAAAVAAFRERKINRIILTRPAVEAGERLGFLPGDLQSKVDPYLRPLYDALFDMLGAETYQKYLERGNIEVAPLAYMRGRTLDDSFIILDEAQNTSCEQMKMFLTRMGFGSKMVITGDVTQIDLPADKLSGLKQAVRVLKNVEGIGICELTDQDVVRHVMVQRIIKAYADYEDARNEKRKR